MATQTLANVKTGATNADNWIDGQGSATAVAIEAQTFYDKALLMRLLPQLEFAKFAQKSAIPMHSGNKINFRRFNSLTPNTTPLTEGVTPAGTSGKLSQVQATLKQYGDFIEISDMLNNTGIDKVVVEWSEALGEQAGQSIDLVIRDSVMGGTNVQYCGGKVNGAALRPEDVITGLEVRKAVRTLRKNNAKTYDGKYFIGLIDPEIAFDLMSDPDWKAVNEYNKNGSAIYDGEIGMLYGVRFIETTHIKVTGGQGEGALNMHSALIFGKNAYGVTDLEGTQAASQKPRIIVKSAGSSGTADPLNQRSTIGWKVTFASTILDNLSMVRLECAVTEA